MMLKLFQRLPTQSKQVNYLNSFKNNKNVLMNQQRYAFCRENKEEGHKDAFNKLKDKIGSQNSDSDIKMKYYTDMFKNANEKLKDKIDPSKLKQTINLDSIKAKFVKEEPKQNEKQQENQQQNTDKASTQQNNEGKQENEGVKQQTQQSVRDEELPEESYYDKISKKDDFKSKVLTFSIDAWRQTFPNEQLIAQQKLKKAKEEAKRIREMEESKIEYTEEELEQMQESIPDWKKTSLQNTEQAPEKISLKDRIKQKTKEKFNQTKFAKKLYETEEYKEYEVAKVVMKEFKEDVRDRIENHPSNVVQGGLYVMEKVKTENPTVRAIRVMRKFDPEFDLWSFEQETKVIFENAFNQYLEGNLELLEKFCSEQALGYFKVLIKKREAEKCIPKYKQLWTVNRPQFQKAYFPDTTLPVFQFTINVQELYCNICKTTGKIVDGSDDNIMSYDFIYSLKIHTEPDIENVGHKWELVELVPQQVIKMLV